MVKKFEDEPLINEEIKAKKVRVVDNDGSQVGIIDIREALFKAESKGLDLVEVSPNSNPPVCKIMDYGKFRYEKNKKAKEAKKKQIVIQIKEIKLRPATDEHDFNFKMKHIANFLSEGDKVKINIFLRGREIENSESAYKMAERIVETVSEIANIDSPPKLEGRIMNILISPKKIKDKIIKENDNAKNKNL